MRFLRLSVISVLGVVVLQSCGGGSPQPSKVSGWTPPAILAHVPADTPYVFAELSVINEKVRRFMLRGIEHSVDEARRALDPLRGTGATKEPAVRALLALDAELRGKDVATWWKELGFDPNGHIVVYGLSVWPVFRAEVADPVRLRSVVARVLSAGRVKPTEATFGGQSYWVAGNDEVSFVAAVLEREAVMAVVPARALQSALPFVLGQQKPPRSLASSTKVPELLARHRLQGNMIAYVDARNVVDIVSSTAPNELDAPLHALTGPVSPACRADLERLAGTVPRMVFGYRKLDDAGFDGTMVFETAPGVAGDLRKLRATVPELSAPSTTWPLATFGVAINPDELLTWLRGVTQQLHDRPFACPWFTPLNEEGEKLARQLATPLPPMMRGVRGFSVTVDNATITPPSVDGHLIVAGQGIADTVTSLLASMPFLGGLSLKGDGRPAAIPTQQFGLPVGPIHVAMTSDRLVVAAGASSAQRATQHIATQAPASSPLFMMAVDGARLQKVLASLGEEVTQALDSLGNIGMTLDVVDDGVGLDIWGTWSETPPTSAIAK
jgi:hypothetical protein